MGRYIETLRAKTRIAFKGNSTPQSAALLPPKPCQQIGTHHDLYRAWKKIGGQGDGDCMAEILLGKGFRFDRSTLTWSKPVELASAEDIQTLFGGQVRDGDGQPWPVDMSGVEVVDDQEVTDEK